MASCPGQQALLAEGRRSPLATRRTVLKGDFLDMASGLGASTFAMCSRVATAWITFMPGARGASPASIRARNPGPVAKFSPRFERRLHRPRIKPLIAPTILEAPGHGPA